MQTMALPALPVSKGHSGWRIQAIGGRWIDIGRWISGGGGKAAQTKAAIDADADLAFGRCDTGGAHDDVTRQRHFAVGASDADVTLEVRERQSARGGERSLCAVPTTKVAVRMRLLPRIPA